MIYIYINWTHSFWKSQRKQMVWGEENQHMQRHRNHQCAPNGDSQKFCSYPWCLHAYLQRLIAYRHPLLYHMPILKTLLPSLWEHSNYPGSSTTEAFNFAFLHRVFYTELKGQRSRVTKHKDRVTFHGFVEDCSPNHRHLMLLLVSMEGFWIPIGDSQSLNKRCAHPATLVSTMSMCLSLSPFVLSQQTCESLLGSVSTLVDQWDGGQAVASLKKGWKGLDWYDVVGWGEIISPSLGCSYFILDCSWCPWGL